VRRDTQHVLLLLLGGALLRISADDTYLRYVLPSHRWLLIAAGAVMVVLAVGGVVVDRVGPRVEQHQHGSAERFSPWLLLVPVLVLALVAPPALGADAVTRLDGQVAAVKPADVFTPLPPGAAPDLSLADFVDRAVWDTSHSLDDRTVTLTGFVVRKGADTYLARLAIYCCAADARVNRVRLDGDVGGLPPDTWLRVRARVVPGSATEADHLVPDVTVADATRIAAPADPYEY
jgi:uncharacterized repeat protein (TIGR03943 family)